MKRNSDRIVLVLYLLIVLLAAFLRLYKLDLRPAHFDEGGGHAIGAMELYNTGRYRYNPDFHGPFLYHLTALSFHLFGMSDTTLRLGEALFGVGVILLMYPLRKFFSKSSFLLTSLLLAVSPSLVYYSRFAVHDSFFVFFNLATVVCLLLYEKYRKNIYGYLFAINLAFLFTVKENAYIFLGILGIYFGVEFLFSLTKGKKELMKDNIHSIIEWVIENKKMLIVSFFLFWFVFILMYTSFFRFWNNLKIALTEPFLHWFKKSIEMSGFNAPYTFYLRILKEYEFAIFVPGVLGLVCILYENDKYSRFVGVWAGVTSMVYLFMPYKEPNNIIHVVMPLAISTGFLMDALSRRIDKKVLAVLTGIFLLVICYWFCLSVDLNFRRYSDEKNYLVYVQTVDDVKLMLKLIKEITDEKGKDIPITVDVPQTEYPLSWYFRDYRNVRYISEKVESPDYWVGIRWSGDGITVWDSEEAKDGNRSAKIDGKNGMDGEWRQKISVIGGYNYKLSGWIKTKDIEVIDSDKYGMMYLRTDKNNNPDRIIAETDSLLGTNDWTYVEKEFFVERGVNYLWLTMTIGNWGKAKGQIWFDNVSLTREGTDTNLIKNPSFEQGEKIDKLLGPEILIISETDGQSLPHVDGYSLQKYLLRPGVNLAVYIKN